VITHWKPEDWRNLDREPDHSADMLAIHAPLTFQAVINAYIEMTENGEDPATTFRGRHVEDNPPL